MVDLDALTALDALQWLRTGDEVFRRFGISSPTVSRQSKKCLELFDVELQRVNGEWDIAGDPTILLLERRVSSQSFFKCDHLASAKLSHLLSAPTAVTVFLGAPSTFQSVQVPIFLEVLQDQ